MTSIQVATLLLNRLIDEEEERLLHRERIYLSNHVMKYTPERCW